MSKSNKCPSYDNGILFDSHPMDKHREKKQKKPRRHATTPVTFEEVAKDNGFIIIDAMRAGVRLHV